MNITPDQWQELHQRIEALEADNLKLQLQLTKAQGAAVRNKQIDEIMSNIDFNKIVATMAALNWTWNEEEFPPSLQELHECAIDLMQRALRGAKDTGSDFHTGSGGFWATAHADGTLKLEFVVQGWYTGD